MTRQSNGRFEKGFSGNPRGRKPKPKRYFSDTQVRTDFLMETEEEIEVPIDGKLQKMPAIKLIYKQLIRTAAKADVRCMFKVIDMRQNIIGAMVKEKLSLFETYIEDLKRSKQQPEEATDGMLDALRQVRSLLDDDWSVDSFSENRDFSTRMPRTIE